MSDANTRANWGQKLWVALGLLVVAGLVSWVLYAGASRDGGAVSGSPASGEHAFLGFEADGGSVLDRDARSSERAPKGSPASAKSHQSRDGDSTSKGTIVRQKLPEVGVGDAGDAGDTGVQRRQDAFEWSDPGNRKMLGRRSWMATPSEEQSQAIDEALDKPLPERYPVDLQERRLGIEIAKDIVDSCFEHLVERSPKASGRIIVAFDLVVDGTTARFSRVAIPTRVHLDDPDFEDCITRALSAASFRSTEQGTMHVEYPFLLGRAAPGRSGSDH